MKAFAFINIIAFMFYIGLLQAQTIYSKQNLSIPNNAVVQENTIQSVFSDLDKSKIPTGVLKDAAVEFVD